VSVFWVVALGALPGCSKAPESPQPRTAGGDSSAGAAAKPALTKIRFRTDWFPQAEHGGFYQALAKGFYREAGLDVEIIPGGPGPTLPQLMMAGTADLAMDRSDDVLVRVSNKLPFVIVSAFMERDPQAILVHDDDPVRSFPDLNGRTIMAIQNANWIDYLKAQYHIDFQLIPLNFGIAQFMANPRFIQQCFITNEPFFIRKNGGHPRTLLIADSGYNPYRVIFAMQRFVREHPEAVRAFVAASIRGWDDFMNGDPAPAKALISQANTQMPPDLLDFTIATLRQYEMISGNPKLGERTGLITRSRMKEQSDLLVRLKIVPEALPLDRFVRFDFLPLDMQEAAAR